MALDKEITQYIDKEVGKRLKLARKLPLKRMGKDTKNYIQEEIRRQIGWLEPKPEPRASIRLALCEEMIEFFGEKLHKKYTLNEILEILARLLMQTFNQYDDPTYALKMFFSDYFDNPKKEENER